MLAALTQAVGAAGDEFITRGKQKKGEVNVGKGWSMCIVRPRCAKNPKWS